MDSSPLNSSSLKIKTCVLIPPKGLDTSSSNFPTPPKQGSNSPLPVRPLLENSLELPGEDVEASIGVRVQVSTIISESSEYKTFYLFNMTFNTNKKEFANKESLPNLFS